MSIAQPKTKIDEVLEQLRPYATNRLKIDQMTAARFKRDLDSSASANYHSYYIVRGMLAVTEWDATAVDDCFQKALRISDDFVTNTHYATALQLLGKYQEASIYARRASEIAPTDLTALRRAETYAYVAGEFELGSESSAELKLRSPGRPTMMEEVVDAVIHSLNAREVDTEMVKKCNALAFQFLRERKVPFESTRFENDAQDNAVMFSILLYPEQSDWEELDVELGDLLFEHIPGFHPGKYWVGLELSRGEE